MAYELVLGSSKIAPALCMHPARMLCMGKSSSAVEDGFSVLQRRPLITGVSFLASKMFPSAGHASCSACNSHPLHWERFLG